jgi:uncharacterized membrane-anchored protein
MRRSNISTPTMLNKVPEITAAFWITKVLTTGMGETTSDYLFLTYNRPLVLGITTVILVGVLIAQFRTRRYLPWLYWLAIVMVAVFGTMVADIIHVLAGVPYLVTTPIFLVALAVIFITWWATQKTLSIHEINTRAREWFYWGAVLATFALGTAAGDLTAKVFNLGYLDSGYLFAVLFALPGLAFRFLRLNAVFAFWFAYVITRPLGASFADWFAMSPAKGGLGFGPGPVSAISSLVILALVIYISLRERRTRRDHLEATQSTQNMNAFATPEDPHAAE